jgi:hypothetical protein
MTKYDIKRGDTAYFRCAVTEDGDPFPLTGLTLRATAKRSYPQTDAEAVFQKSSGNGIELDDSDSSVAIVRIDPADTEGLGDREVKLLFDLQLTSGTEVFTLAEGLLIVAPDVTLTTGL